MWWCCRGFITAIAGETTFDVWARLSRSHVVVVTNCCLSLGFVLLRLNSISLWGTQPRESRCRSTLDLAHTQEVRQLRKGYHEAHRGASVHRDFLVSFSHAHQGIDCSESDNLYQSTFTFKLELRSSRIKKFLNNSSKRIHYRWLS